MIKNRRGNISIVLLAMFIVFTLAINSMLIIERKTLSLKRQNIQDAVIAANLASYSTIEQGEKNIVLSFGVDAINYYISNPDSLNSRGISLESIINTMNSEYFPKGERYKSIYIQKEKAYDCFSTYLETNLELTRNLSNENIFTSTIENKGDISSLEIQEFEVYNAIYANMVKPPSLSSNLVNEKRKYTGIHLILNAKVRHDIKYGPLQDDVNVPIHIDTEITLDRPVIN